MKMYLPVLLVVCLFSSCGMSKYGIHVAAGMDASEENKGNFIKMKSGKEISLPENIDIVKGTPDLGALSKMKINGVKINPRQIESFQINGDFYANQYKNVFARRIYKGSFNIFENTTQSTTTTMSSGGSMGSGGSMHTHTSNTSHWYVQKPEIDKGNLYEIRGFGQQQKLPLYISDYQPSMQIYEKYRQQRHISRIVKFATAGLWLSSIPILFVAKRNSSLYDFGLANAAAGVIYMPIFALTFKAYNHTRPFQAVQKYIDNNVSIADMKPAAVPNAGDKSTTPDAVAVVPESTTITSSASINSTTRDFLVLDKQMIIADEGTKLRSANNKIFFINGTKYTNGVTAYQIKNKYYRRFPDMKNEQDFAQRSIKGRISVFNVVKGKSQANANIKSSLYAGSPKSMYFVKEQQDGYIRNATKLYPYFEDNAKAKNMYSKAIRELHVTKTASLLMSAATVVSMGIFLSQSSKTHDFSGSAPYAYLSTGLGIFNYYFTISRLKKNRTHLVEAIEYYNRAK